MTPTGRTLALLRKSGYLADVCERWIPRLNRRRDLFHFGDVLGVHPIRREVVIVQCTTLPNLSARLAKIRAVSELPGLLAAGVIVQAHGWARRGASWHCKVVDVRHAEPVVMCRVPRRRGGKRWEPAPLFEE